LYYYLGCQNEGRSEYFHCSPYLHIKLARCILFFLFTFPYSTTYSVNSTKFVASDCFFFQMGCVSSTSNSSADNQQNKSVDNYLKESKTDAALDFKVLLLGAGESGKSTVVKQLKVLYKLDMDPLELRTYAVSLHKNTLQCMQVLVEQLEVLHIPITHEDAKKCADKLKSFVFDDNDRHLPASIVADIVTLWKNEDIQKVWSRRSEFWFLDASPYYFENINRFLEEDFVPTEEDCIMTRIRTTGISVTEFDEGPVHFRVVDVGGQRNERKKWIHCFDDVKALLFVVDLAGYDQVMFEDASQNRMKESLLLFSQICNNPVFANTPIFLFLNKKDLFESLIRETSLKKCFPEYDGQQDVQAALQFITSQFQGKLQDSTRSLRASYIAARSKKDVKYSWEEVKEALFEENRKGMERAAKSKENQKKKK